MPAPSLIDPFSSETGPPEAPTPSGPKLKDPFSVEKWPEGYEKHYHEFEAYKAPIKAQMAIGLGFFLTPDEKAREDIVRRWLPEAEFYRDPEGRTLVKYKGENAYLNKPGFSLRDYSTLASEVLKFIPASKLLASGGRAAQLAAAFWGPAATSVAEDVAAMPLGSEQGIVPERALATGIAGTSAEFLAPYIGAGFGWLTEKGRNVWRALRNTPQAVAADGTLTDVGRRLAAQAGLNPDEMTMQLAQQLDDAARQATSAGLPENAVPGAIERQALSRRFNVPLTRGELTDDFAQQSLEENLRRMDVTTRAGSTMREAERVANEAMRGESGTSGFGMLRGEVGGARPAADVAAAGQQVMQGTRAAGQAAREAYQAQYRIAREAGASLGPESFAGFVDDLQAGLKSDPSINYDPTIYPKTAAALNTLKARMAQIFPKGVSNVRVKPIKIGQIESLRKYINVLWRSADPTDQMGLNVIRDQFDEMFNAAVDNGQVIGDDASIKALQLGRSLYQRFRQLYAPESAPVGTLERRAGSAVQQWLRSESATGEDAIRNAVMNPALARRVVEINGQGSPAHLALKQGVLEYVFRPALKNDGVSPRLVVSAYDRWFKGAGRERMQAIFSPSDLTAINEFSRLARARIPQEGVVNYSNTASAFMRSLQELGKKLGIAAAGTGNIQTAAALGGANAAMNQVSAAQARAATRGLAPSVRMPGLTAVAAGATSEAVQQ